MNLSSGKDDGDANCCSNRETPQKCCTDNAAEALVSIVNNSATTNGTSSPAKATVGTKNKAAKEEDNATGIITGDGKPGTGSNDDEKKSTTCTSLVVCPNKRRKRTVSVDFSNPCDCCPSEDINKASKKAKTVASPAEIQQRTFVDDLAALAKFLKEEREFWMSTASCSSLSSKSDEAFFQPSPQDTALVAEWRKSGRSVHTKLQEQVRRLKDMEAKFGAWETHHFDDDDDDKTEQA